MHCGLSYQPLTSLSKITAAVFICRSCNSMPSLSANISYILLSIARNDKVRLNLHAIPVIISNVSEAAGAVC